MQVLGQGSKISDLLRQQAENRPDDFFDIGILLEDRLDVFSLYQNWKKVQPPLEERSQALIHRLKTKASQTQPSVIAQLQKLNNLKQVRAYRAANVIFLQARGKTL